MELCQTSPSSDRDVRVCQIYEGASDIQRLVIGRAISNA
jgi:alkylation response protein AidB-like acyl-CoA dehydrogenase